MKAYRIFYNKACFENTEIPPETLTCFHITSKPLPHQKNIKKLFKNLLPTKLLQTIKNAPMQTFTQAELATYNGINGNPAYIAVNGTVYDVTNEAAWAAATHFGLSAGKDLTTAFVSCHDNQALLNQLKIVGKMTNES